MAVERTNMSNQTEILNQYLSDPQYRQIRNIFNDEDFERYVPLYLIIGYIMNQPYGDKPKNLYTDVHRRPSSILNQLRPYLIASDLNIDAIIECIRHIDRTETKRILKVGFPLFLDILETFLQQSKLPPNNNQQLWL